jgi:hypothetical protein
MSTSTHGFDMKDFHFVRSTALNKDAGQVIAALYLHTNRLRDGLRILGLLEYEVRLKSLVSVLQINWGGANHLIKSAEGKPNQRTGELSSSIPAGFVLGKSAPDEISGNDMVRAVMNVVVFVVRGLERDSPQEIPDEKAKKLHKFVVLAMFVEAIHALQHNQPSDFTDALFSRLLVKVVVYPEITRRHNESDASFHLRTVEGNLKAAATMRDRDDKIHRDTSLALQKAGVEKGILQRDLEQEHRISQLSLGVQVDLRKDLKESQSKSIELEHDLKEEKTKRKEVEQALEEEKSKSSQLERDFKEQKSKASQLEHGFKEQKSKASQLEHDFKEQKSKTSQAEHDRSREITKRTLVEDDLGEKERKCAQLEHDLKEEKSKSAQLEFDVQQLRRSLEEAIQESEHRVKKQKLDQTTSAGGS